MLRAEREWSQEELAERLYVSRQTINAVETGTYDPGLPLAFKIVRLFGPTIEQIFFPDNVSSWGPAFGAPKTTHATPGVG